MNIKEKNKCLNGDICLKFFIEMLNNNNNNNY